MRLTVSRWIFLVILFLIIQVSANFSGYKAVYQDREFLMESVHQILTADLDGNRQPEIIVTGKNYTTREVFIYWMNITSDFKPVIRWQSANLFEDLSVLWICAGKFTSDQTLLLAITNQNLYFYRADKDDLIRTRQEIHNFTGILSVAGGDINGDGLDELVIARIGKIDRKYYNGVLQVWRLNNNDKPSLLAESGLLGNIRGITAGDIDSDGKSEIVIDEGLRFAPGNIRVFGLDDGKLVERFCLKKGVASAVYSMTVAGFKGEIRLVTASSGGKVNFFTWKDGSLARTGTELAFDNELVSVAALEPDKERIPELIVVGYPQDFSILSQN